MRNKRLHEPSRRVKSETEQQGCELVSCRTNVFVVNGQQFSFLVFFIVLEEKKKHVKRKSKIPAMTAFLRCVCRKQEKIAANGAQDCSSC